MKIIKFNTSAKELPIKVLLSMEPLYKELEKFVQDEKNPLARSSKEILAYVNQFPELRTGIEDWTQMQQYEAVLKLMLKHLFPTLLQTNEIKAVAVPFHYKAFYPTKRFADILTNAGEDYELRISGFNIEKSYWFACSFILAKYYDQPILKLNRPTHIDIPNKKTGQLHRYRVMFNADNIDIIKTDAAPDLTQADIDELLANGDDLALWKKKFPPDSYIMKGFGIMNLFDTTPDVLISRTRSLFLRNDDQVFPEFKKNIRDLFGNKDLMIGMSNYDKYLKKTVSSFLNKTSESLFMRMDEEIDYRRFFCEDLNQCTLEEVSVSAISDVSTYAKNHQNLFAERLLEKGIQSILLVPIEIKGRHIQLLEIASTKKNELNILVSTKMDDILPFIKIAAERYYEENENTIESTIQENYTSIHPSVKWRFIQAAVNFNAQKESGVETPKLEDIVFENVYPLYGQSDIVSSSAARNEAIQADLILQLALVIDTFDRVLELQPLPIYRKLIYRVQTCLESVEKGLNAGDEAGILDFLRTEIYPVFNHLMTLNDELKAIVQEYVKQIDDDLKVIYRQRKAYELSVNLLNEKLSGFLDRRQVEAQAMFPHYFERYKTDGVEYNMYIGNSLVNQREFDPIYLQNLRLWQLETMCQIENKAFELSNSMPFPLRVASLILVYSSPLSVKFHMDQKQFDVDGAYNARYEIVKKRIDKSLIRGTNERLTQAGKIAIVYSQDSDVPEYLNYIEFLQSENKLGKVEMLELEDLQGISGLKAIRVEVIYRKGQPSLRPKNGKKKALKSPETMVEDLEVVVGKG
ncbi:MAG: GAF domain-containing protein [Bacteroidota bacterium]